MKQTILLVFLYLIGHLNGFAQHIDAQKGMLYIPGYTGNAVIIVNGNAIKVQKDDNARDFPVQRSGSRVILVNPQDSAAVYDMLHISSEEMNQLLKDNAGQTTIGKLLDIAGKMPDSKLVLTKTITGTGDTLEEEGAQPVIAAEATDKRTSPGWLWPAVIGVAALAAGFIAGRMLRPASPLQAPAAPAPESTIPPVAKPDHNQQEQLHQELEALREKNKVITEKTQALIAGDELYYNQVFKQIILPLQEAIHKGNHADMVRYMHQAATHLSSITRTKIRKKLNYDDANIQLITGNPTFTREFPEITPQTPIDQIPANIRNLIQVLRQNGVNGLDDSIILGYKLKQI